MKLDYQEKYRAKVKENIPLVRKQINNRDFRLKIQNRADKYGFTYEEVKNKIMVDDMYATEFIKDPSRQNIYEKEAANYIANLIYIQDFMNLPNSIELYIIDGVLTDIKSNNAKSIDFKFSLTDKNGILLTFFCSHKYIKATFGGHQDNQYADMCSFLRNCQKRTSGNEYFIGICDGEYFTNKLPEMISEFSSNNVKILTIEELDDYLQSFL